MPHRQTLKGIQLQKVIAQVLAANEDAFYLEGSAICFNVIHDRLVSAITHGSTTGPNRNERKSIPPCITKLKVLGLSNPNVAQLLPPAFLDEIFDWKNERDVLMHELATKDIPEATLKSHCSKGIEIMRKLASHVMKLKRKS